MEVVNDKAARVLRLIFRTAMNRQKPFGSMTNEAHEQAAYQVATEGIVLLKMKQPKSNQLYCLLLLISISRYWL